jgi:hypothetical protein
MVESAHNAKKTDSAEKTDDNYAIEAYRMRLEPDLRDFQPLTWYVYSQSLEAAIKTKAESPKRPEIRLEIQLSVEMESIYPLHLAEPPILLE